MNINDDFQRDDEEFSQNKFTFEDDNSSISEKMYIPRRRHDFLKIITLVIGGMALFLIAAFIVTVYASKKDDSEKNNEENLNLLNSLVIAGDKSIWMFDVDTEEFNILKRTENSIVALDTHLDKAIFWSESGSDMISSLWSDYSNVTHSRKWKPQSIAFDYVTEKFYLIDKLSGTVNVVDKNGKYHAVLISDLRDPHDLVLDPLEGLLFVVQLNQSIVRANMDGTSVTTIINSPGITAITLDIKAMKIYWANDKKSIEISDYDGNRRTKIIDKVDMGVDSLMIFENSLYWTSSSSLKNTLPYSSIIWSCALNGTSCINITFHKLPFENPTVIRASYNQYQHKVKNPCEKNNNDCQHLCVMTSRGSHNCMCNIGWTLNSDGKTCSNNVSMIVYIQDDFVRGKILHETKEGLVDSIIPTKIYMTNLKKKSVIYFDYDIVSGKFFFTDDHTLYEIDLSSGGEQRSILNVSQNFVIGRIAYDWMHEKIYFVQQSQSLLNNHTIEEFSLKNGNDNHTSIITLKSSKDSLIINCPLSLMVHPTKKYLFYILYDSRYDYIQRIDLNNASIKPLILSNSSKTWYELISLDIADSELYYVQHDDPQTVRIMDLDGSTHQSVKVQKTISAVKFVSYSKNYFYVGNFTGIWQINRATGESEREITKIKNEENGKIHSMKIYSIMDRII